MLIASHYGTSVAAMPEISDHVPVRRIARLLDRAPIAWLSVMGGHTPAGRGRVELDGGSMVFAKWATDDNTAQWLRAERRVIGVVDELFVPRLVAWEDGERPLLVIEDLGDATWPPPWTQALIASALDTLQIVASTTPPPDLPSISAIESMLRGWHATRADPAPFLGLGLADAGWLERNLPTLIRAEASANLGGDDLLHLDVRGDNMAFLPDRVVLVDWNWASVGNIEVDVAFLANHIEVTGGPSPEDTANIDPSWAAVVSGYFGQMAGLPGIPTAPTVRPAQRAALEFALPWASRMLDLEPIA